MNGLTILVAILIVAAIVIAVIGLRALFHDPGERARPFREPAPEVTHTEYTPYDYTPAPEDMGPGAGLNLSPGYNSRPAQSQSSGMKADSPAPADPAAGPLPTAPPPVTRVPLPPVTAPALAVLHALTAPVRAHLQAAEQAREAAWQEHVKATSPWADDGSFWDWTRDSIVMAAITDGA